MNQLEKNSWQQVLSVFQAIWGYDEFRKPQGEIVRNLLAGKDALIIMPTGGGKSICFQLPALLQNGLTLVVSPLVALMENQVQELQQKKLPAALLHSELSSFEKRKTLQNIAGQKLRLLYLSPETLLSPPVWEKISEPHLKINALILDEAHCLVQWGDTFRPAYRRLGAVRKALLKSKPSGEKISIAAFTATADLAGQKIIKEVLQLQQPEIYRLNPYRSNLSPKVHIAWTPRGRKQQLFNFVQKKSPNPGLVYVRTRSDSENIAAWLEKKGYPTASYHAGLNAEERRRIETQWLDGEIPFVVCTSAFGMGINKSNVRWVIHFHPPLLLSEYVQEIGRAGRDGLASDALMLVSEPTGWLDPEDKQRQNFFTEKARSQLLNAEELIKKLPPTGNVAAVSQKLKDSALALSLLHSMGKLEWVDPFHYKINHNNLKGKRHKNIKHQQKSDASSHFKGQTHAIKNMKKYITTKNCRWQFLLDAFGFTQDAENWCCGHCDNCRK
ncbi:MAG: ATP-dependent DNA helicase RecQ [Cyanobacteria bacterium P01_A01_bin.84]